MAHGRSTVKHSYGPRQVDGKTTLIRSVDGVAEELSRKQEVRLTFRVPDMGAAGMGGSMVASKKDRFYRWLDWALVKTGLVPVDEHSNLDGQDRSTVVTHPQQHESEQDSRVIQVAPHVRRMSSQLF